MIDDVLTEHGRLLYVLPLAVHLYSWTSKGDNSEPFLLFEFFGGTPPSCLKVVGGWWVVAYRILVSSQGPLVLGFLGLGLRGLGPGLDNKKLNDRMLVMFQLTKRSEGKKILL